MFKKICLSVAMSFFILSGFSQVSRAEEAKAPKWYDTISVSGFVDAYYSYNMNGPQNRQNVYQNFDFRSNDFDVSLVELNIVKPVDDKNKVGFYIGLAFGGTADWVACGSLACNPSSTSIYSAGPPISVTTTTTNHPESPYKNFRQAYASMLLLPNLQLDFGKFVTQHGAEVIESQSNWNYTHSLLFSWAIPYYHSGARLTYTLNDMLYVQGAIVNGWNNVTENNNGKTYGVQLGITPVKPLPIVINYMTGPENIAGGSDTRSLLDIVATYNVTDSLSLMANYDDGVQKQGINASTDAKWSGYAVYAKYAFASSYAAVLRYEQLDDKNGFATGTGTIQKLSEGTLTLEYSGLGTGSLIRLDLRQDKSDKTPFVKEDGTLTDSQNTITLGVVQTF